MQIPLFKLNYDEDEYRAFERVLNDQWISMGPRCSLLEELFAKTLQAKYALAVTNCTAALHLALLALDLTEGDEVIVPSLTFVATVNVVRYVGAIPVFADVISDQNLTIDPKDIEQKVTKKTKAIICMHYAGFPCQMDKIMEIAKKYNLYVIEDACHGPMSEYHGRKLGTIGDIGCFSFFSNKNISAGEGGMVVTNDEQISKCIKLLRSHGMTKSSYEKHQGHATSYNVVKLGYNYRLDDIRAALTIAQLNKLPADIEKRTNNRKLYTDLLSKNESVVIPFNDNNEIVSNYIFPIVLRDSNVEKREAVRNYLQQKGVQTSVHYPAVHRFDIYKEFRCDLPMTEYLTDCEITLPMYGELKQSEIEYVCKVFQEALERT